MALQFRCPECGGFQGFRSRPRTFIERYFLPLFLLRPVRCGDCFRRSYRFALVRALPRHRSGVPPRRAA